MQSLNRSQGIYDFVMCGRETAHRWKKGWTHNWKEGVLSGSVPPKYTSGTCGARNQLSPFSSIILCKPAGGSFPDPSTEGPGTALLLTWVPLCPMEGSWRSWLAATGTRPGHVPVPSCPPEIIWPGWSGALTPGPI